MTRLLMSKILKIPSNVNRFLRKKEDKLPPEAKNPKWLIMEDVMLKIIRELATDVAKEGVGETVEEYISIKNQRRTENTARTRDASRTRRARRIRIG